MVDFEQRFVLIQRVGDGTLTRGVVTGIDHQRDKVIVRGLSPLGGEFLAPMELLDSGIAESRNRRIRYLTLPLDPESLSFLKDNQ